MDQFELEDVAVDEVSLVSKAANRKRYVLFKSEAGAPVADPPATETPAPVDVVKAAAEVVEVQKAEYASVQRELAELRKSNESASAQIAQLVTEKKLGEYASLAKSAGWVHGSPAEHAERLMKMASLGEDFVAGEIQRQNAIAEEIKKSEIFKEYGVSGNGSSSSAESEAKTKALELVAKSDGKLDLGAAISQTLRSDRTLAARFNEERRGRGK